MSILMRYGLALGILLGLTLWGRSGEACPFCAPVSQTFTEEMASMDAVVIARLTNLPAVATGTTAVRQEVPKATFEIVDVLKGTSHLGATKTLQTLFFGTAKTGEMFLVMGVDPPEIAWSTPMKVSERSAVYLRKLGDLPPKGADRLGFFQKYLEDQDATLARDSYDEFARAPYSEIQQLKPRLDREQILTWIKDPQIPANRRRLYLVMLSVCGGPQDLALLEQMLRSEDRQARAGLDAIIGCYLTLAGPEGMPLIEELFLKNTKAEYADTYAAIMALRFHGTETEIIPRARILQGLRHILDRIQLADLVIPDLARWEDWSQMERLVTLFKQADDKSSWVRVPVINYLRACPRPEAKQYLEELEKIDPDAVKRASSFFPFGGSSAPAGPAS